MVEAMRARPKTTVLAVLLLSAGLVLGLGREALALAYYEFRCTSSTVSKCGTWPRDSDGSVPQRVGELNPNGYHDDGWIIFGRTNMMYNSTRGVASIVYDHAAVSYCHEDRGAVYAHEHAHARGWNHWEKPAEYNAAYTPSVTPGRPCRP